MSNTELDAPKDGGRQRCGTTDDRRLGESEGSVMLVLWTPAWVRLGKGGWLVLLVTEHPLIACAIAVRKTYPRCFWQTRETVSGASTVSDGAIV